MFTLDDVVPWGRSYDEYCRMFALTSDNLASRILGCGDGPASFNAEATRRGARVVSCDPLYQFDARQLRQRIDATSDGVLEQARQNVHEFVWTTIRSIDELGEVRMAAMRDFLDDYPAGAAAGRYVTAALPQLPFADGAFDLSLCSHFLFLYSGHFDRAFHEASMLELCRVAREVRVFPLLALGALPSPHLDSVRAMLTARGSTSRSSASPTSSSGAGPRCCGFTVVDRDGGSRAAPPIVPSTTISEKSRSRHRPHSRRRSQNNNSQ